MTKSIKKNWTYPDWFVERVEKEAKLRGVNPAGYVVMCLERYWLSEESVKSLRGLEDMSDAIRQATEQMKNEG